MAPLKLHGHGIEQQSVRHTLRYGTSDMCVCMYVCIYVSMYLCIYVYVYVYVCMCVYV